MASDDTSTTSRKAEDAAKAEQPDMSFLTSLSTAPCFRESVLHGVGGGSILAALHLLRNRDAIRSSELMIKSGCIIASLRWIICRRRYYDEREMTYKVFETQKQRAAERRAAAAKAVREKVVHE